MLLLLLLLLTHLCSHSPALICVCLLLFLHSHSPAPVGQLSSACSHFHLLTLPHSHLPAFIHVHVPSCVCPHSFVCVFPVTYAGLCLHALVRVCGCSCHLLSCCRSCHHVLLVLPPCLLSAPHTQLVHT